MRRVLTFASAISLLLCVALIALWVRSYFDRDSLYLEYHNQRYTIHRHLRRGIVTFYRGDRSQVETSLGYIRVYTDSTGFESERPLPRLRIERGLSDPIDFRSGSDAANSWFGISREEHVWNNNIRPIFSVIGSISWSSVPRLPVSRELRHA